jgi:hypothetical protein
MTILYAEKTDISNAMDNAKHKPQSASAEVKLAELKRRLLEISDLRAAGALLSWDQATYLPERGAPARARQGAIVSRRKITFVRFHGQGLLDRHRVSGHYRWN